MTDSLFRRSSIALACLAVLTASACDQEFETPVAPQFSANRADGGHGPQGFEVYTQNVYLGGDTSPLFGLDFNDIFAVIAAVDLFWGDVQDSDAPSRVAEFIDEIEERRPHVVALQEVLDFALLDEFQQVTDEGIDFLALIEAEIDARGLPYETAVTQETTSSKLPLALGSSGIASWLEFTDRVAILRRTDVPLLDQSNGLYQATINVGGIDLLRGWTRLTVDHQGTPHHVIATHLETQATGPLHDAQADELIGFVAAGLDGVTIIAGDLNSDAAAEEGALSWTATYDKLIADGFTDVWESRLRGRRASGLTCCFDKDLTGDTDFIERIDFVMVRSSHGGPNGVARGHYRMEVVGEETGDRTVGGLWPSDHAGLIASIRLPSPDAEPRDSQGRGRR